MRGLTDPLAMIYAFMSKENNSDVKDGQAQVAARKAEKDEQLRKEREALQREKEAEGNDSKGFFGSLCGVLSDAVSDLEHLRAADAVSDVRDDAKAAWNSPNFWRDLEVGGRVAAEVAAVVGGACATVATFGTAAPAMVVVCAALILSSAGTAESNFHVLEACGVDPKVAGYVGLGCSLGGAVAGGVGGFLASGQHAAQLVQAAKALGTAANVGGGAADVVAGTAHIKTGNFDADAEQARADQIEAQHHQRAIQRVIEAVIDDLKTTTESHERAMRSLGGAMHTRGETMVNVTSGRMA